MNQIYDINAKYPQPLYGKQKNYLNSVYGKRHKTIVLVQEGPKRSIINERYIENNESTLFIIDNNIIEILQKEGDIYYE